MPLLEFTDENRQMRTAISQEEGRSEVTYLLTGSDPDVAPPVSAIDEAIAYFLGGVTNLGTTVVSPGTYGAGKVVRILPAVHPFRPELSAAAVEVIGYGRHEITDAVTVSGLPLASEQFPNWTGYLLRVTFQKRPYFLRNDSSIEVKSDLTYFPPDGSSGIPIRYAEEWKRFTTTTRTPTGETVSASAGQMTFRTQSGTAPDGNGYTGLPFMSLQNELVEVTWFNVPYRYFQEYETHRPYLTRFVSTVNQHEFMGFAPGSLLFLGANPTSYIPATPDRTEQLQSLASGFEANLLCNVKLRFLATARVGTNVPSSAHALLTNKNFVAAGHNLLPNYGSRTFAYAVGDGESDAVKRPAFESFPFALLFTDPLLMQQGGAI